MSLVELHTNLLRISNFYEVLYDAYFFGLSIVILNFKKTKIIFRSSDNKKVVNDNSNNNILQSLLAGSVVNVNGSIGGSSGINLMSSRASSSLTHVTAMGGGQVEHAKKYAHYIM